MDYIAVLLLGILSGVTLTLMDRIDEHHLIERHRTPLAYLTGISTVASMAWTIESFPVLYPLPFFMCIEWIIKNKIDFPSHVFSLFLTALYFGWRIDLLQFNALYIAIFLGLRFVSGTYLRKKLEGKSVFFRWYYASYLEKFVCNIIIAIILSSFLVVIYSAGFTVACLYIKKVFPEKKSV